MKQTLNLEMLNAYVNISCYMLQSVNSVIFFGPELLSSRFFQYIVRVKERYIASHNNNVVSMRNEAED